MGFNLPLGHGAVVTVDPKTGKTQYYEFGLHRQRVRKCKTEACPKLKHGERWTTKASLDALYKFTSEKYGHSSVVTPTYYSDANYKMRINMSKILVKNMTAIG
jgi:hypothetical protein